MEPTGLVLDIRRCCVHDGPGIRTTVFLKGCPLRCRWCSNPASWRPYPEILFRSRLCVNCGACGICPNGDARETLVQREACIRCFRCTQKCHSGAIQAAGNMMCVSEVLEETLKDVVFYKHSGGGITLSGGEPLAQPEFMLTLLRGAHESGLHTCVATCGYGSADVLREAIPYVDLFLWDVKDTCPERHYRNTGVFLDSILDNLRMVDALGAQTQLHCILVEGINTEQGHLDAIQVLADSLRHCVGVEFFPRQLLGSSKYSDLGFPQPKREVACE